MVNGVRHLVLFLLPYEVPVTTTRQSNIKKMSRLVPVSYSYGQWHWINPVDNAKRFLTNYDSWRGSDPTTATVYGNTTLYAQAKQVSQGTNREETPAMLAHLMEKCWPTHGPEQNNGPREIKVEGLNVLKAAFPRFTDCGITILDLTTLRYAFLFVDDKPHNLQRMSMSARAYGEALALDYVTFHYVSAIDQKSTTWNNTFMPVAARNAGEMSAYKTIDDDEICDLLPRIMFTE